MEHAHALAVPARVKYVRARMPGRELVHLVPADNLTPDAIFGDPDFGFVTSRNGPVRSLCGKPNSSWVVGRGDVDCLACYRNR